MARRSRNTASASDALTESSSALQDALASLPTTAVDPEPVGKESAAPMIVDFWTEMENFCQANNVEMPKATIMSKTIDRKRMFDIVMDKGGFHQVRFVSR
jgi:hypothetical protein